MLNVSVDMIYISSASNLRSKTHIFLSFKHKYSYLNSLVNKLLCMPFHANETKAVASGAVKYWRFNELGCGSTMTKLLTDLVIKMCQISFFMFELSLENKGEGNNLLNY